MQDHIAVEGDQLTVCRPQTPHLPTWGLSISHTIPAPLHHAYCHTIDSYRFTPLLHSQAGVRPASTQMFAIHSSSI